jgi:hypothetical protein
MKRARESEEEVLGLDVEVSEADNYVDIHQELSRVLEFCLISDVCSVIVGYLADVVFLKSQKNPSITIPIPPIFGSTRSGLSRTPCCI